MKLQLAEALLGGGGLDRFVSFGVGGNHRCFCVGPVGVVVWSKKLRALVYYFFKMFFFFFFK